MIAKHTLTRHTLNRGVNFVLFNALWPVCVIGAAQGLVWPGVVLTAIFLLWQCYPAHRVSGDGRLVLICVLIGTLLDTLWIRLGWLNYASPGPWPHWAPVWISMLWVGFALALNHSLAWIQRWPVLSGMVFIVLAPFSYAMASRFDAVQWLAPWWQIVLALGFSWVVLVCTLLQLAKRWRGEDARREWPANRELA